MSRRRHTPKEWAVFLAYTSPLVVFLFFIWRWAWQQGSAAVTGVVVGTLCALVFGTYLAYRLGWLK